MKKGGLLSIIPILIIVAFISQCGNNKRINSIAFSPDDSYIVAVTNDKSLLIYEGSSGERTHQLTGLHGTARVNSVAIRQDSRQFVTGGNDKSMRVWNVGPRVFGNFSNTRFSEVGGIRVDTSFQNFLHSLDYSPGGRYVVAGFQDKTARLFELTSNLTGSEYNPKLIFNMEGHKSDVLTVSFSPNGAFIATGSKDKTIKIWEASTGENIVTLIGHNKSVKSVIWSPDGRRIISGSDDKKIIVWDVRNGDQLAVLSNHTGKVLALAYDPDGKYFISGSTDKTIRTWSSTDYVELGIIKNKAWVTSLSFNSDGSRLVAGFGNRRINIFNSSEVY